MFNDTEKTVQVYSSNNDRYLTEEIYERTD